MDEQMYTVPEVSQRLRVPEATVRRMLRDGRLRGNRLGGTRLGWRIPESAIRELLGGSNQGKAAA